MWSKMFFVTVAALWSLATATAYSILEPVSDDGWNNYLSPRSTSFENLKLTASEHFVWSSPTDSGDNIFVNMTMATGGEELIISMERFADQLKSVNCSQDMMMSFKSQDSYSIAIASWDWVNFSENRTFILIANYPGCGIENTRQPWVVSNADYDPANLAVHLNATKQTWAQVAHTYSLDFGRYGPPVSGNRRRQFSGSKQITLDLAATLPVDLSSSYQGISITCKACGTQGKLSIEGHIESSWFKVTVFTITAKPSGVEADLNLALSLSGSDPNFSWKPDPITFVTIPLGGFSIPELLTLGPDLQLGAGMAIDGLKGSATISSSVKAVIPDSSIAQVQLAGNKGATFSGWSPQFSAAPLSITSQLMATAEVFGQAKVGLAVELLGQGIDVALVLKVPDVVLTAKPVSGVPCGGKTKVDNGVSLAVSIGANLGIKAATHVDGVETDFVNVPMLTLGAKTSPPFLSTCVPF